MKKKGFTLIELLAVIVILAIIALIATPIILSMINNARKSASKSSTYGYIEAIESNNGFADAEVEGYTKIEDGTHDVSEINVPMKGKAPDSGSVEIEKGKVKTANICINGFTVTYNGHEAEVGSKCDSSSEPEVEFNGTYVAPTTGQTHKGIVYLDPSDLKATCTASSTLTKTNTGCKKFYIFDDSGSNYKMIMDRNISNGIPWLSESDYEEAGGDDWYDDNNKTSYGPITVTKRLESDTAGWEGNPRLITAQEVASVIQLSQFSNEFNEYYYFGSGNHNDINHQTSDQQAKHRSLAWLFDYTYDCSSSGCDIDGSTVKEYTWGYWTSTPVTNDYHVWMVQFYGVLSQTDCDNGSEYGIRPVITLKKSIIK